jgi:hypothetical protein
MELEVSDLFQAEWVPSLKLTVAEDQIGTVVASGASELRPVGTGSASRAVTAVPLPSTTALPGMRSCMARSRCFDVLRQKEDRRPATHEPHVLLEARGREHFEVERSLGEVRALDVREQVPSVGTSKLTLPARSLLSVAVPTRTVAEATGSPGLSSNVSVMRPTVGAGLRGALAACSSGRVTRGGSTTTNQDPKTRHGREPSPRPSGLKCSAASMRCSASPAHMLRRIGALLRSNSTIVINAQVTTGYSCSPDLRGKDPP